jgi:hypothetical protein
VDDAQGYAGTLRDSAQGPASPAPLFPELPSDLDGHAGQGSPGGRRDANVRHRLGAKRTVPTRMFTVSGILQVGGQRSAARDGTAE